MSGVEITAFGYGTVDGTGCYGYVAWDPARNRVVVAFAGSSNTMQWIRDAECGTVQWDTVASSGAVYGGPFLAYRLQRKAINRAVTSLLYLHPGARLLVTGHSLGGAQAHYAAMDFASWGLRPTVFTFGSPRPGDSVWAASYDQLVGSGSSFRVTHYSDPVPHSPPMGAFPGCSFTDWRHVGTEIYYGLSVEPGSFKMCPPGVENRYNRCGSNRFPVDPTSPLDGALWGYHLCYPGQCGYPLQNGLPCELSAPYCMSPATAFVNCLTGNVYVESNTSVNTATSR